jgi:peptidoglycan hydrolase FlgJ
MDLVGDVLKQADAAKLRVATRKLEEFSRSKKVAVAEKEFRVVLQPMKLNGVALQGARMSAKDQSRVPSTDGQIDVATKTSGKRTVEAMRGLETVLATKMVESMMPKDQSRIYGEGAAGDIWRGMHIEVMGKALASRGLFSTTNDVHGGGELHDQGPPKIKSIVPFAG